MATEFQSEIARIREETDAFLGVHHTRLMAFIDQIGQRSRRPKVGDQAPDFALPDASGRLRSLDGLLEGQRALALVFVRGLWCPYCSAQMTALQAAHGDYLDAGVSLVDVTPETGGRAAETVTSLGLGYDVLCDVDEGLALSYGCLIPLAPQEQELFLTHGYDLAHLYGNGAWFMPLATTFVIAPDRTVRAVFGETDQRQRPEPADVLQTCLTGV